MTSRHGFVTTLESILAATVFLIFLVNVLPDFVSSNPEGDILEEQADTVIDALDRAGGLRDDAKARNLSAIQTGLEEYINGINLAVGLSWTNRTDGEVIDGVMSQNFTLNQSAIERERLLVWLDSVNSLTVSINSQEAASLSDTGFHEIEISDYTEQGDNNITLDGSGTDGRFTIEQYYYTQNQDLPSVDAIYGTSYVFGTNSTDNEPRELQVYLWR
ncbi:MAG: hypothetical protein MUP66_01995 [Candidatus Nanohaloarchaeota archaeon QJJ-5]|nr:hypothetical protein [Candidatus Nanohaloarchaeota archaeon QJJ-5]